MRGGPGLGGRGDDHDRLGPVGQPLLQRLVPADLARADDECHGPPATGGEQVEQALADPVEVAPLTVVHHDHQDLAVRDRVAEGRGVERVNPVVPKQRGFGRREGPHGSARSQIMADLRITDFGQAKPNIGAFLNLKS